ncbi:MAG TPA: tetratricopeptide repeat protein [Gemmatimonadales bacterium]|nr:tetratricopeptide repeat protein [Gemmatimonadales bacterium]
MRARARLIVAAPLVAALGLGGTVLGGSLPAAGPGSGERAPLADATIRDQDIAFYEARTARDPAGALDRTRLATLYLARARELGAEPDLVRAESTARASLARRRPHNSGALAVLAGALLGQHRFIEARDAARELAVAEPESPAARALLGEVLLELGEYREARSMFLALRGQGRDPAVATRLARWHELEGRPAEADRLLRVARDRALALHGISREQRAWFHLRVGDLALRYGRLSEAAAALDAGLADAPDDHRLLAARARLAAARHAWAEAIAFGNQALAASVDPATLGLLADAHLALGDTASALEQERVMDVALRGQRGPSHRAWSLHLLDRGRDVPQVLVRAEDELRTRRDVYGWDVYAWALHKAGRREEAAAAIDSAMALGTKDPLLAAHARAIRTTP